MYSCWKEVGIINKVNNSFKIFSTSQTATSNIIHSLVNLRNLCAHQARIWNKTVMLPVADKICDSEVMTPIREKIWNSKVMVSIIEERQLKDKKHLKNPKDINERSILGIICVLMALVDQINDNKDYSKEVIKLFEKNEEFFKGLIDPNL